MIWALVDLIRRRKVKWLPKFGWALIVILVNLFGPIAYLLFGRGDD
ncbi:MAG TPA: PLD nuclease N-terminal domain-containing protein [Bacillota bacterium]|nr:PLD nuclease N-terminal domain-containing protein [Bacillota bacterium]